MSVASVADPIFIPTIDHEREGFIRCGTLGHSWHDYDSNWRTDMGTPLTLRCERCGTERRDVIGAYGQLVYRTYAYPKGYKWPKGERPNRSQFRIMLLTKRMQSKEQETVTHIEMPPFDPDPPEQPPIPDDFKTEFPCQQCDRVFPSGAALNGHMIVHREPVPCPECGKQYKTPGALGNHRKMTHGHVGPWAEQNAKRKRAKEDDALEVMQAVQERKDRKKAERAAAKSRIATDWTADDIFQSVITELWPGGAIPTRCILPLVQWREATREFLEKVQSE